MLIQATELDRPAKLRLDFLRECIWAALPDGRRKTVRGISRILKNHFPDWKVDIYFTFQLCTLWMRAGVPGLVAAAEKPFDESFGRLAIAPLDAAVKSFAYKRANADDALFFNCDVRHLVRDFNEEDFQLWRLAAQDRFGTYEAFVAAPSEPDIHDAQHVCLWQFRIGRN